jgi:hypothetical protein
MPTNSTGRAPRLMRSLSLRQRGGKNRRESDGARQIGHEAPSCGRAQGYPARGALERGQRP